MNMELICQFQQNKMKKASSEAFYLVVYEDTNILTPGSVKLNFLING